MSMIKESLDTENNHIEEHDRPAELELSAAPVLLEKPDFVMYTTSVSCEKRCEKKRRRLVDGLAFEFLDHFKTTAPITLRYPRPLRRGLTDQLLPLLFVSRSRSMHSERSNDVGFTSIAPVTMFKMMQTSSLHKEYDVLQLLATCQIELEYHRSLLRPRDRSLSPAARFANAMDTRAFRKLKYYQSTALKAIRYLREHSVSYLYFHEDPTKGATPDRSLKDLNTAFYRYGEQILQLELTREIKRQQLARTEQLQEQPLTGTDPEHLLELKKKAERIYTRKLQKQERELQRTSWDIAKRLEDYGSGSDDVCTSNELLFTVL